MIDKRLPGDEKWLHMKGGYADTYICTKNKRVVKFCDKFYDLEIASDINSSKQKSVGSTRDTKKNDKSKQQISHSLQIIHYSTICDLVFSKSLDKIKGFPRIDGIHIEEDKIRIDMNYLGKTLHDASHTYSIHTRWMLAPKLIEQLTTQCFNLYYNGLQHTDIKPGNVLIDDQDNFHLIDFNCMAISNYKETIDGIIKPIWSEGIGTYHYVSPEILFSGKPYDTSMVWSIAMVTLHWLLGQYPISNERMTKYIGYPVSSHTEWKRLMSELRRKYSYGLQLEKKYIEGLSYWWTRMQGMLKWNPHKRWTLEMVLQSVHLLQIPKGVSSSSIHVKNIVYNTELLNIHDDYSIRQVIIEKAYIFLETIQMKHLFVSSIMLFDKCYSRLYNLYHSENKEQHYNLNPEKDIDLVYLCCWAIQGYLDNLFLFDQDRIVFGIYQIFGISCDKIIQNIYFIGKLVEFEAWQKEWYRVLLDMYPGHSSTNTIDWKCIKSILIERKTSYNSILLAQEYARILSIT